MTNHVNRECPVCAVSYKADPVRLRHGRQTTCSRACSYALRANKLKEGETFECPVCEIEFTRSPSQVKSKHSVLYCSAPCMYKGRTLGLTPRIVNKPYVRVAPINYEAIARAHATRRARNNYGHTDDTRARLSEATARAIAEGRISPVSKLEDEVAEVLDGLGVSYTRQAPVRGADGRFVACVDFMLSDGRALEVNGTFWHTDPRVYPDGPTFPAQARTAERWDRKISALDALGIPVVVVWEKDLRDDFAETLRVALASV